MVLTVDIDGTPCVCTQETAETGKQTMELMNHFREVWMNTHLCGMSDCSENKPEGKSYCGYHDWMHL